MIQFVPAEHWVKLSEVARIRTEAKVIDDIKVGSCDSKGKCTAGGNATWSMHLLPLFVMKDKLIYTLLAKLQSSNWSEQEYVFRCFGDSLPALEAAPSVWTIHVITTGLKAGDKRFYDFVGRLDSSIFGNAAWFDAFKAAYDAFKETPPDDMPF